jgi:ADP-heptose:LPS heptosyltransferase
LTTHSTELKTLNSAAINTATQYSNALIARNQLFYAPDTGLVDVALATKAYIKSVFGASSPQYKLVAKLTFKRYKI